MGRAKLNLELIPKEKARNLTFKKRKEGIMKKMREFTTLCDVNACMIIYGPNSQSSEPAIWPNDRSEVERMIELYKEKVADNSTRSYGISNFFMDRKKKLEEEVRKLKQKNLEAKYPTNLEFMDRMSKPELENFVRFLDGKLEAAAARMEMMNEISNNNGELQQQSQAMQIFPGYNNQDYYINSVIDPMQIDNLGYVTNPLHHQHVVYNSPNVILDDDQEKNYGLLGYANPNPTQGPGRMMIPPEYMHFAGGASSSSSAGAGPGGFIIYNNDSFPAGYRQQQVNLYEPMMSNVMAQYSIDRTTMQLTMVPPPPPYMGSDLPPLPPCYLEMNEVKCTLPALPAGGVNLPPQISPPSYYLEEKETNNNYPSTLLPQPAGGSGLPQLPPPRSCMEDKEVASSSSITHYHVTNQITRFS